MNGKCASRRERPGHGDRLARWRFAVCLAVALAVAGCSNPARSPDLVCRHNGRTVKTGFTLAEFRATVEREHGGAVLTDETHLSSPRGMEVHFRRLDARSLLVERIVRPASAGGDADPAAFFGVAN